MKFLSSEWFINITPYITTFLLESANVQQIVKMIVEHSSKDQSIGGWICINVALWFWWNLYRVKGIVSAQRATLIGITISAVLIVVALYYRHS